MPGQYLSALKDFGLSENEIAVYIALLKLGEATAQHIAKTADLPRTTTYHLLDGLVVKGVVGFIEKGVIRQYRAARPARIADILRERKKRIEEVLPELDAIAGTVKEGPKVVVYEGLRGVKAILQETLHHKKEILHYGDIISLQAVLQHAFPQYIARRVERKIPIRVLCKKEDPHEELLKTAKRNLRSFVFIPKNRVFKTSVFLYAGKVAILSLQNEPYYGMIIDNPEYYETEKNLFELLWDAYKR